MRVISQEKICLPNCRNFLIDFCLNYWEIHWDGSRIHKQQRIDIGYFFSSPSVQVIKASLLTIHANS